MLNRERGMFQAMLQGSSIADLLRLRPRNIRNRLLRDLTLIVLLTSSAILFLTVSSARRTHKRVAGSHIEQAATFAAQEFEQRLRPVNQGLVMAWEWGKMGLVDATHPERVMAELTPVLRPLKKVTAVVVADSNGREVYLSAERNPDGELQGWLTRARGVPESNGRYLQKSWSPEGRLLSESWEELPGYVPEERPWFVGAIANESDDAIFRSPPYLLHADNAYGVSESMRWVNEKGTVNVVAFDMFLSGIFQMVNEIQVSQNGIAFLCNSSGAVFVPSPAGATVARPTVFVSPHEVSNPLISSAIRSWLASDGPTEGPVRFESPHDSGWAGFRLLDTSSGLWIGVAVPEPDIFGTPIEGASQLVIVLVLILVLGVLLALHLIRKYAHQLTDVRKQLVGETSFEEDVGALIARGEGRALEFKSTVRRNLKTDKNGKEIELAWLKGAVAFLNTEGGTVLIGIGDDGDVVGVSADRFESDDRCRLHVKNLVNQHIGAEFSQLIQFQVGTIGGKSVVVIQCERSSKPVFLRVHNKEAFFIRSGPSSIELSPREVLEYVQNRS